MIKIVGEEMEIKKYTKAVKELFVLYKSLNDGEDSPLFSDKQFKTLLKTAFANPVYAKDTLKGKILRESILGNKSLTLIAEETMYSVAHIYAVKQKIYKEFASVTFGVIILWEDI